MIDALTAQRIEAFQSTLPARGATACLALIPFGERFQSTLPARGATNAGAVGDALNEISIHAPRTGSDGYIKERDKQAAQFQSTLPARGATASVQAGRQDQPISIHAPRTGSDQGRFASR